MIGGRPTSVALGALIVMVCAPLAGEAKPLDWSTRRAAQLTRTLDKDPANLQVYRSLLELRLKAPARYTQLSQAATAKLAAVLVKVEQDESRANLMVTMLARGQGAGRQGVNAEAAVERTLSRMYRADRVGYQRFRVAVDTYLTSLMDTTHAAFGHTSLFSALKASRGVVARAGSSAGLYDEALARISSLRGLFAAVESSTAHQGNTPAKPPR